MLPTERQKKKEKEDQLNKNLLSRVLAKSQRGITSYPFKWFCARPISIRNVDQALAFEDIKQSEDIEVWLCLKLSTGTSFSLVINGVPVTQTLGDAKTCPCPSQLPEM